MDEGLGSPVLPAPGLPLHGDFVPAFMGALSPIRDGSSA